MSRQGKRCPRCDSVLPAGNFRQSKSRPDGLSVYCRHCLRELDRQRYADPERRSRHLANMRRQYKRRRKHKLAQAKRYRDDLRMAALSAYGGKTPRCACCGESHIEFLELDHVNGDGATHRREVGSTIQVLRWLRKHDYPTGFQVLCRNCNLAKWVYKRCPHRREH